MTFVESTDFDVRDKFEKLLNGGTVEQTILDEVSYDTLDWNEDNLWNVLLMTGYLTKADPNTLGNKAELKIPDAEIFNVFEETAISCFRNWLVSNRHKQKELMQALWDGNVEKASYSMTDILLEVICYRDYHEDFYHAFMTCIISGLGYAVKSNQENGMGRSDIDVREKRKKTWYDFGNEKIEQRTRYAEGCIGRKTTDH